MALQIEEIKTPGYEKVVWGTDETTGLNACVAIHNSNRGPACGGIRMLPYASREEAIHDVLRLAKGMSYKSALAELGFGGGKSVIVGDPGKKTNALFHSFGEFLNRLSGEYIAAKDMNISSEDLKQVKQVSKHVLGIDGEPGSSGDPSPVTARGVLRALEATTEELKGTKSLAGLRLSIQGIGYVGYSLAEKVVAAGGKIWVTDIDSKVLRKAQNELNAQVVGLDEIYDIECDVFAPCARGAILNTKTIPRLKCQAVVGCANNQLETESDGFRLHERGIIYAPDYAVNSGGIINIFVEFGGYDQQKAFAKADRVYFTIKEILQRAKSQRTAPFVIADQLAEERLGIQ